MKYAISLALSLASMLLAPPPLRADVAPPEVAPCSGKQAGAACTYNSAAGVCQDSTCGRLDYANWDRDASTSPPTMTYACLKCATGSATATVTSTVTDTNTTTATTTTTTTTTTTATATTDPTTTTTSATATDTGNDNPPADDDGACSIGRGITAKRVAPWILAASFSLLFLFGRRRRS